MHQLALHACVRTCNHDVGESTYLRARGITNLRFAFFPRNRARRCIQSSIGARDRASTSISVYPGLCATVTMMSWVAWSCCHLQVMCLAGLEHVMGRDVKTGWVGWDECFARSAFIASVYYMWCMR